MKKITCCKDCTERAVGCHSQCERYLSQKREQTEDKEARRMRMVGIYYARDTASRLIKKSRQIKRR